MNNSLNGDVQKNKIQESTESVLNLLRERGIVGENSIDSEKLKKAKKDKQKKTYHNTIMLLQNYRKMVWLLECFPETIASELERPFEGVDTLLEHMDMEISWGNRKLEHRMEGIEKSRLLIDRVNEALTVLKKEPKNGDRLYKIVYLTYIVPEQLSHSDLLYRLNISSRHYYRLRQQAITILSLRLWTAPTSEIDLWLEMLTILEEME